MKKFLKLIAENQPGEHGEYTVTLTDPSGKVENQFTITGGDFAFDNFQAFKQEMTGETEEIPSEDQEMDIEKTAKTAAAVLSIPSQGVGKQLLDPAARQVQTAKRTLSKKLVAAANAIKIS